MGTSRMACHIRGFETFCLLVVVFDSFWDEKLLTEREKYSCAGTELVMLSGVLLILVIVIERDKIHKMNVMYCHVIGVSL
jgi:hypothetical protein